MFEGKQQYELVQLLQSGASFAFDGSRKQTYELVQMAAAVKSGGGMLTLSGLGSRQQYELVQISQAGAGHVVLT